MLFKTNSLKSHIKIKATKEVINYLNEYEKIAKFLYRPPTKKYVDAIAELAGYYATLGIKQKAGQLYQEYNTLIKTTDVPKEKNYFLTKLFYSRFLFDEHKYEQGQKNISELFSERLTYLLHNLFYLNEYERELFWAEEEKYFNEYISISAMVSKSIPESTELAYNTILLTKGLLMESTIDIQASVINSSDTSNIVLLKQLKKTKGTIAKIFSSRYQGPQQQQHWESNEDSILMKNLDFEADSIEQVLARSMLSVAEYKKDLHITWGDVKSKLTLDESAIEFAKYYDWKDSSDHYLALIIVKNSSHPQLVNLCSERQLEKLSTENDLSKIYSIIWEPLEPFLHGIRKIYYSPVGRLNNIAFNGLYKKHNNNREYLLDKYELNQLTTTRYLATGLKESEAKNFEPSIALFGDINYDELPESKHNSNNYFDTATASATPAIAKNDENNVRYGVSYLPATRKEVENIAKILGSQNWDVSVFENRTASENKIKSLSDSNGKSIIHIATHGFSFPEPKGNIQSKENAGKDAFQFSDNPMIRSGLLFSGANLTWQGKSDMMLSETHEDGILTAWELSQISLNKTKLVVLSACETGKGDIYGSEGTMGLKRALKIAGVENMIISLWKVDDEATMELMTLFYSELSKSKDLVSSFTSAQKAMRNKYPIDPKKWAGFVFVR